MKYLSLEPDDHMKWIYDASHPEYLSARADWLRKARQENLCSCPKWMIEEARINDILRLKVGTDTTAT